MPPRGSRPRGRGRGKSLVNDALDMTDNILDPILNRLDTPANPSSSGHANPSIPDSSSAVYTTDLSSGIPASVGNSKPSVSKFKPRMVKRLTNVENDADLDEPSGSNHPGGYGSDSRGRGRGRGGSDRGGRGRPEIVMTASGAFAMGPAEASSRTGRMNQGPSRSGMRKIDNSIMPSAGTSRGSGTNSAWDGGPDGMLEVFSDVDDDGSEGGQVDDANRTRVADLNDITLEHSMAPLSLPWDPKRIADREKMIKERKEKMMKLENLKIKRESQMIDSKPVINLNSTASSEDPSFHTTRECTTTTDSSVHLKNEEKFGLETDDVEKREIALKKEQFEELSKVGKQFLARKKCTKTSNPSSDATQAPINRRQGRAEQGSDSLYIFQFPRNFPKFKDPKTAIAQDTTTTMGVDQKPMMARKILKKKKPGLDDWMGWGKGGRRIECMGVPLGQEDDSPIQGQIGELVIRRSGRVQMIIANVAYDVLPGAQPTFHQEIAVIDPKPESNLRAMFVLGSTFDKFIVVPNVSTLLKREQSLDHQK